MTIRSVPSPPRLLDDRLAQRAGADDRPVDLQLVLGGAARRSRRARRRGVLLLAVISASSGRSSGTLQHVEDADRRGALLGEPHRGREHLLADRAQLERHEDPLVLALELGDEIGAAGRPARAGSRGEPAHARRTRSRPRPATSAPRSAPRRAWRSRRSRARARAGPRSLRQRERDTADRHVERRAEGARELRLRAAQPQHRHLRGEEREQHAEAVEAREGAQLAAREAPRSEEHG